MAAHTFQEWPRPYRVLLQLAVVTLAAALLLWLGLLPGWRRHQEYVALVKEKEAVTDALAWPKDSVQLRRQLEMIQAELDGDADSPASRGLRQIAAETLDRACVTFRPRMLASHVSATDFMCNVTRLDYKALYNDVEAEMAEAGLKLSSARLADTGEDVPVYQLIYRLWCVQRMFHLGRESGLTLIADAAGEADFRSLAAHSYVVDDATDSVPYLLEFSTAMRLRGTLSQFRDFCASLYTETDFMPLTTLQICTTPPAAGVQSDGHATVEQFEATISCSAFFPAQ